MASWNKCIIVGYLGRDPELRYTPAGDAVCDFSMATTERRKDKSDEYQDSTTWWKVTLWRKMAESAGQYLSKGSQVYIEGRASLREYQDRDGNTRYSLEVQGTDMKFLGGKGEGREGRSERGESRSKGAAATSVSRDAPVTEDEIPF